MEYSWSKESEWQVESEWLDLGNEPVMRRQDGRLTWALVCDRLGSVRAEVTANRSGRPVVHHSDSWPYGEAIDPTLRAHEGHHSTAQWREYRGTVSGASVLDGLDFMHAREYDWRRGRFLEPDPIGSSWNAYAYALGNPVNFTDPKGLRTMVREGWNDLFRNTAMGKATETVWDAAWTMVPGVPELGLDSRPGSPGTVDPYESNLVRGLDGALPRFLSELPAEPASLVLLAEVSGALLPSERRRIEPFLQVWRSFRNRPVLAYGEESRWGPVGGAMWLGSRILRRLGIRVPLCGASCTGWAVGLYTRLAPLNSSLVRAVIIQRWTPLPHTYVGIQVRRRYRWRRAVELDPYWGTESWYPVW